jgi:hypothetical protein
MATARPLAQHDEHARLVSQRQVELADSAIETVQADAAGRSTPLSLTIGPSTRHNCAVPPYWRWRTEFRPLTHSLIEAAEASGAPLISSNLYRYVRGRRPDQGERTARRLDDRREVHGRLARTRPGVLRARIPAVSRGIGAARSSTTRTMAAGRRSRSSSRAGPAQVFAARAEAGAAICSIDRWCELPPHPTTPSGPSTDENERAPQHPNAAVDQAEPAFRSRSIRVKRVSEKPGTPRKDRS